MYKTETVSSAYLLVCHLEELQGRLLQLSGGFPDLLWIGCLLVGQQSTQISDFLFQLLALKFSTLLLVWILSFITFLSVPLQQATGS